VLPVPFPSLTEPLSDQLLRHTLPHLGIDIEQSTAVGVLAPWAEFYPHLVSRQFTEPLRRLLQAGLAPFRRIHSLKSDATLRTVPVPAGDEGVPVYDSLQRIEGAVEATSPLPEILVLETTLGLGGRPPLDAAFVAVCDTVLMPFTSLL